MSESRSRFSRRQVLRGALTSIVAVQAITLRSTWATEALSEDDPMAKALAYVEDASAVSKEEQPTYSAEQDCANCLHYQGKEADIVGGCAIFPGKSVTASGWCKVWAKK